MRLRIGTAGWAIPAGVRDCFPLTGGGLERYAARLGAVEINSTFYRRHRISTFERWAAATPADFRFAVKAPREITHLRNWRIAKTCSRTWPPISGGWATAWDQS
jgi:uncharacterized protein YecE (DUF72 family)